MLVIIEKDRNLDFGVFKFCFAIRSIDVIGKL